jgi:phosphonate transport system permease protein
MATRTSQQDLRPSLVPPPIAGVASLLLPGLGQILARQVQRGLLLLGSLATSIGLFAWRVSLLAPREVGALAKITKALDWPPARPGHWRSLPKPLTGILHS